MRDLISRAEVMNIIQEELSLRCGHEADIALFSVKKKVSELPITFDTEKVVEQMEEVKGKACTGKKCFSCVYNDICCEGEMSERVAIDNAIKIVLKGGTTD